MDRRIIIIAFQATLIVIGLTLTFIAAEYDIEPLETGTYTGFMSDAVPDDEFSLSLEAGQVLHVIVEATSGDLDPLLLLMESDETIVAIDDDRAVDNLDAEMVFIASEPAQYILVVSNIEYTSGEYQMTVDFPSLESVEPLLREVLSGPVQTYDTEHFRIHYTTEGTDATEPTYAELVAKTLEDVRRQQIDVMGWPPYLDDYIVGGDARYDVYLMDLILSDDEDNAAEFGSVTSQLRFGDNPHTPTVEHWSSPSYMILDNDYAEEDWLDGLTPHQMLRATAAHEFHHAIQFGYDALEPLTWYYEATSTWMEIRTFPDSQDATGYVEWLFDYPEVCFGAQDEADPTGNLLMYGHWLFIQTLVDRHGEAIVAELWTEIAIEDGWIPLENTLATYDDTITDAVRRYHLHNLLRDYDLPVPLPEATVWLEGLITDTGEWDSDGVQELGAGFFKLALPDRRYAISIDRPELELWTVGIVENTAEAFPLHAGGVLDTGLYDEIYMMVFHPAYDDTLYDCVYETYTLRVEKSSAEPTTQAVFTFDAADFIPLD